MKTFIPIIATLFLSIHLSAGDPSTYWNLVKSNESIEIFDHQNDEHKYRTFRVTGIIPTDLSELSSILMNTEYLVEWFPMASSGELISNRNDTMIVRVEFDFPFPMKDRDAYIQITQSKSGSNQIIFNMGLAEGYAHHGGFERLEILHSTTTLSKEKNGVYIDQITYLDPGGSIPKIFLNSGLPGTMLKSFDALINLSMNQKI